MSEQREKFENELKRILEEGKTALEICGVDGDKLSEVEKVYPEVANPHRERCLNDSCGQCKGSGTKIDGTSCIHMIFCPCSKCNFR
jgi:hypothetical protein